METCTLLIVTSSAAPWTTETAEVQALGRGLQGFARKQGGSCSAHFADGRLVVAIQGLPADLLASALKAWREARASFLLDVTIEERNNVPMPQGKKLGKSYKVGSVIHERLNRRMLFALPDGAFIISGICDEDGKRKFAERVGGLRERPTLWKKAIEAGVNGKMCDVVWTEADFQREVNRWGDDLPGDEWKKA